jgi:hypothetical protein
MLIVTLLSQTILNSDSLGNDEKALPISRLSFSQDTSMKREKRHHPTAPYPSLISSSE